MKVFVFVFALIYVLSLGPNAFGQGTVTGSIKDSNGAVIPGANIHLSNSAQAILQADESDANGSFRFDNVPTGSFAVTASKFGFRDGSQAVTVSDGDSEAVDIVLSVGHVKESVTVTAELGKPESVRNNPQSMNLINSESILERATSVLAQAGEEEAGLNLQRTSPTIGAIVVRGMTGKNVVNFIDGVRFTHAGQRGGINTFFNLNEPTNLQAIEVLRGPNGAQYGSDSLSGTVNLITKAPVYGSDEGEMHGDLLAGFNSADRGFGGAGLFSYGNKKFGGYVSFAGRRFGTTRTADGLDSHSAITRFLGLSSSILYDRNPDTDFDQYGGALRANYAFRPGEQIIFHYQRNQQDGGQRFDQMLGGDGNLIADLRNLMLDFGYLRYIKQDFGPFDSGSFTLSYNSQREERVNQGGQGNPFGDITHQYERTSTWGGSFFFDKRLDRRHSFLVGGDLYAERLNSPAYIHNPVSNAVTLSRPRVPDEASFNSGGGFVQYQWEAIPERLRVTGALRYGGMSYQVRASDSPIVSGQRLWADDELSTADLSGRIGAVVMATEDLRFVFNYGRGFRYPSMTDLGTLGLTGDGFEVDHITAGTLNGRIGTTAGVDAVTTGLAVEKQRSEHTNSFDFGFRYNRRWFDTELTVFRMDIVDAITKQALILPQGSVGQSIAGQTITGQTAGGAVFVTAAANPVLVRSNYSEAKLWGIEYETEARLRYDLLFRTNFTYIKAADKETGLPPNIEGGTPPPTGFLALRYDHPRFWVEGYTTLAYKQDRLSSLDLGDRRTGATRTRAQIENFFRRGACVADLTVNATNTCNGNVAGYTLVPTGENITQVLTRVLGPGFPSSPLFSYLPGYAIANVRGGINLNEKAQFFWAVENIFDQFYRNPSWGIDGPGRSFVGQFRFRF